jgi:hypothetical protein
MATAVAACASHATADDPAYDLSSGKADGFDWCHAIATGDGGTHFQIDFQWHDPDASPVWVNVANDAFHSGQQARAVVVERSYLERCGFGGDCPSFQGNVHDRDMRFEHGRFTIDLPEGLPLSSEESSDNPSRFVWELAVVVDGTWYKNGDSNLVLDPWAAGVCN